MNRTNHRPLPGGLLRDGELRQTYRFKPVTGRMEMAFAEMADSDSSLPVKVTTVLLAALASLGDAPADWDAVHTLSVGDRQFLMREIAVRLGHDDVWLTARCRSCSDPFDIRVQPSAMPVKKAGETFPYATVRQNGGNIKVRVPTGLDQETVCSIGDAETAQVQLAARLIVREEGDGDPPVTRHPSFSPELIREMEQAIENTAPEVSVLADARCPSCETRNQVRVDPYLCLQMAGQHLFTEVHTLAAVYHWSEDQILALPRKRRQKYLRLIDLSRGMMNQPDGFQPP